MKIIRNQHGGAIVLELIAIAIVLVVIGGAIYNGVNSRRTTTDSSPAGLAATASSIAEQDATADGEVSAAAESISGQVLAADADLSNLGGASDADF